MSDDHDRARFSQGVTRALRRPWRLNDAARLALDAFAQRYAVDRGLSHRPTGDTPPATWFLETVTPAKSHSFLAGDLGAGTQGALFYAERAVRVKRGQVMEGWTVALLRLPAAAELAYGIACRFRPGAAWGGGLAPPAEVPRGLTEVSSGDETVDARYLVAVTEDDRAAAPALFSADFAAWLGALPGQKTGGQVTRFELRGGVLCVYAKPKASSAGALDAFRERAVHIATRISQAAREA